MAANGTASKMQEDVEAKAAAIVTARFERAISKFGKMVNVNDNPTVFAELLRQLEIEESRLLKKGIDPPQSLERTE